MKRKLFGNEEPVALSEDSSILLLDHEGMNIAFLVDQVLGIQKIPQTIFHMNKVIVETDIDWGLIKSVGKHDLESIVLLDIEATLDSYTSKNVEISEETGEKQELQEKKQDGDPDAQEVSGKTSPDVEQFEFVTMNPSP